MSISREHGKGACYQRLFSLKGKIFGVAIEAFGVIG